MTNTSGENSIQNNPKAKGYQTTFPDEFNSTNDYLNDCWIDWF